MCQIVYISRERDRTITCILTSYTMDSSFWVDAMNLEWSIIYIKGSHVMIIPNKILCRRILWRFTSWFTVQTSHFSWKPVNSLNILSVIFHFTEKDWLSILQQLLICFLPFFSHKFVSFSFLIYIFFFFFSFLQISLFFFSYLQISLFFFYIFKFLFFFSYLQIRLLFW